MAPDIVPDLVIGLAALPSRGKGTTAKIIQILLPNQTAIASSGMILRSTARRLNLPDPDSRKTCQDLYMDLASGLGNECLHGGLKKYWEESGKRIWVFDGVLMPWDVKFVKSFPRSALFYIECGMQTAFERARQRSDATAKTDEKEMAWEEFKKMHEHETAKHVASIKSGEGVILLDNHGPPKKLCQQIVRAFEDDLCWMTPQEIDARRHNLKSYISSIHAPEDHGRARG